MAVESTQQSTGCRVPDSDDVVVSHRDESCAIGRDGHRGCGFRVTRENFVEHLRGSPRSLEREPTAQVVVAGRDRDSGCIPFPCALDEHRLAIGRRVLRQLVPEVRKRVRSCGRRFRRLLSQPRPAACPNRAPGTSHRCPSGRDRKPSTRRARYSRRGRRVWSGSSQLPR